MGNAATVCGRFKAYCENQTNDRRTHTRINTRTIIGSTLLLNAHAHERTPFACATPSHHPLSLSAFASSPTERSGGLNKSLRCHCCALCAVWLWANRGRDQCAPRPNTHTCTRTKRNRGSNKQNTFARRARRSVYVSVSPCRARFFVMSPSERASDANELPFVKRMRCGKMRTHRVRARIA